MVLPASLTRERAQMPITDVPGKARALYDARRTRTQIPPFTDEDPTLGMADGYAVQKELVDLILADGDAIVGYKAGLTSRPMQRMIGVDSPDYGAGLRLDALRRRRRGTDRAASSSPSWRRRSSPSWAEAAGPGVTRGRRRGGAWPG